MICPSCGLDNVDGAMFCRGCGAPLASSAHVAKKMPEATGTNVSEESSSPRTPRRRRWPVVMIVVSSIILAVCAVAIAVSLLGRGEPALVQTMRHPPFKPEEVLYVGLQNLHPYQKRFLDEAGVAYRIQTGSFVPDTEIAAFAARFGCVLVHCDIDVLDERFFHSTYFANPELKGDGSGGGKMTTEKLAQVLRLIDASAEIAGLTVAEYLPFDEERLSRVFAGIRLFGD